ncbi:hypothetical protein Taro_008854 [Colocasia esculenta]|uniref:Uncharacterized protein n=1 Tax=Colocasia esculenta TaxID=4460 RepID=A0A843TYG0_COLES|nr:hypothetical protein [Colocasia esculenta]
MRRAGAALEVCDTGDGTVRWEEDLAVCAAMDPSRWAEAAGCVRRTGAGECVCYRSGACRAEAACLMEVCAEVARLGYRARARSRGAWKIPGSLYKDPRFAQEVEHGDWA